MSLLLLFDDGFNRGNPPRPLPNYVLNEDGSYMLDENGNRILVEDSDEP